MQGLSTCNCRSQFLTSLIFVNDAYLRTSLRQQFVAEGFQNISEVGSATELNAALKDANGPDTVGYSDGEWQWGGDMQTLAQ